IPHKGRGCRTRGDDKSSWRRWHAVRVAVWRRQEAMSFRTVWKLPRAIIAGFFANKPFQLAAALSYYTLLSMAPLLLLLTGLAGLFFGEAAAREHVLRYVGTTSASCAPTIVPT